ncbi:esterase-like activity of phytase family protein [Vibrio sp. SCSIO 43137]|uniref:esterase-like activity of phytase family protein n=1 Tax=Vibrio sp. SCSIO 43137 TaxID=3021011 RepID=UPI002307F822|nr:esterase-like activity of phytase family protein [Vibrio sp. SCSIO 43137]WCE32035.1 esterase-like activity of phytase family protein [Vibrio sp. SCSIO 43137]
MHGLITGLALLISLSAAAAGKPKDIQTEADNNFRILQSVRIDDHLVEISDIAFDKDENILYAIGDKGDLYHLKIGFGKQRITQLKVLHHYQLRPYFLGKIDSEGLALQNDKDNIKGNTQLLVSFERTPAIIRFDSKGEEIEPLALPEKLSKKSFYNSKNKMLEALAYDTQFGLITSPQDSKDHWHRIFNITSGKTYKFNKSSEISGYEYTPQGDVIVIERRVDKITNVDGKNEKVTTKLLLKHVALSGCKERCASSVIKPFDIDNPLTKNYESLTRISDNTYLMANDNDQSDDTYFVYFRFE